MAPFEPADHTAGDANTVGGYRAVHGRPAAFEGKDGASYSVEVVADDSADARGLYGAYLLFVRWRTGDPVAAGHLETEYLAYAASETDVLAQVGATLLGEARRMLDALIDDSNPPTRPWYEVMRDA